MTSPICDVAIVGAGPYGLSIAAHLRNTRLKTRIFGKPMESWRDHMPEGMMLKSEPHASNLFDPMSSFTLEDYCRENNIAYKDVGCPLPLATFAAYGVEFQRRLVPHLEQTTITSIERTLINGHDGFVLQTEDGQTVYAHKVILAVGITHFTYKPSFLDGISEEFVTHTFNHSDLSKFKDRKVAVLGSGASAVDMAARLNVAGAKVELIARSKGISFHEPSQEPRPLLERIKNPRSSLGLGWRSKISAELPQVFYSLPQKLRFKVVDKHLGPAPGWFVRDLVEGRFPQHMSCTVENVVVRDKQVHITIAKKDGSQETILADHLIAGTGFRVDVERLQFLAPELRSAIEHAENTPVLTRTFESSVRGLYFTGLASANSFGPPFRFACGAEYTAKQLLRHIAPNSLGAYVDRFFAFLTRRGNVVRAGQARS